MESSINPPMDKDKLIEKLKTEKNFINPSYRTIASVNLSEAELDLILTSLTTPVPDGNSYLFDKSLLEKATIKQPKYMIGVDTFNKDALAYCFIRKVDGVFEIILDKTMRDEKEFNQEVENLVKYFDATLYTNS